MPRRNLNASQSRSRRRQPKTIKVLSPQGRWEDAVILHEGRKDYWLQDAQGNKFFAYKPEAVYPGR